MVKYRFEILSRNTKGNVSPLLWSVTLRWPGGVDVLLMEFMQEHRTLPLSAVFNLIF